MLVIVYYCQVGYWILIDDFGIGYFSLSYLQKLDVDMLKIDKFFVDIFEYWLLMLYIIEMVKVFNLVIVVEGVEIESQCDWLCQYGVQYVQGWFYSKVLLKEQFILWVEYNFYVY